MRRTLDAWVQESCGTNDGEESERSRASSDKKVLISSPLAQAHHSTVDYGVTVDTSGIYIRSFF